MLVILYCLNHLNSIKPEPSRRHDDFPNDSGYVVLELQRTGANLMVAGHGAHDGVEVEPLVKQALLQVYRVLDKPKHSDVTIEMEDTLTSPLKIKTSHPIY